MRRFESAGCIRLRTPAGTPIVAWRAESVALRLAGLALMGGVPAGRALLIPRCRSVHTIGMRFAIDVAFIAWPPGPDSEVLVLRQGVRPLRVVAPPGPRRWRVAALEAAAGQLRRHGVAAGSHLSFDSVGDVSERSAGVHGRCSNEEEMRDVREIPQTQGHH
jgi:uncharacterized membrane protein (UPF0127 family)